MSNASLIILISMAAVLSVLAALQYRWITEVSEAQQNRQKENLAIATSRFGDDFDRELRPLLFGGRRPGPPEFLEQSDDTARFVQLYDRWTAVSQAPELLKDLYFARIANPGQVDLLRFYPESRKLEAIDWPPELSSLHDSLAAESMNPGRPRGPGPRGGGPEGRTLEYLPALVSPVLRTDEPLRFEGPPPFGDFPRNFRRPLLAGWQIILLNQDFLSKTLLPQLAQKHFSKQGDFDYEILVAHPATKDVLYRSSPDLTLSDFQDHPDAAVPLLRGEPGRPPRGGPPDRRGPPDEGFRPEPPPSYNAWQLYAKHHSGSLQSFTNQFRRRNLLISFGVFTILGLGMAFTLISSERVRALGKLQLEFAAGLSHELRTPLAVIRSAAYNLAAGSISGKDDIVRYGNLLQEQGVRLSEMVEQALLFAQTQSKHKQYELRKVEVRAVIQKAIDACRTVIPDSSREIVVQVREGTPPALTDANALGHCVQNLLINALKYGSAGQPITVTAEADTAHASHQLRITVENGGPGIDASDLPHIFEPFFRGRKTEVVSGNGLGLYLVKRIIESVGGRVMVSSSPAEGTRFTLFIPAAT
jgi:signal transduction histidine kinase